MVRLFSIETELNNKYSLSRIDETTHRRVGRRRPQIIQILPVDPAHLTGIVELITLHKLGGNNPDSLEKVRVATNLDDLNTISGFAVVLLPR